MAKAQTVHEVSKPEVKKEDDVPMQKQDSGEVGDKNEDEENRECVHVTRTMPQFQYDKDTMYELSIKPLSKMRPKCLSVEHDNSNGLWDPEKWFKDRPSARNDDSFRARKESGSDSSKRPTGDPKERIKEEESDGIILSPQRRSFGTGCQVINQQRRIVSPIETHEPSYYKESNQPQRESSNRRVGSGRLVSRSNSERLDNDREYGYKSNTHREYNSSRHGRDKEYDRDHSRRSTGRSRYSYREPPEWYSEGPTSQHDTIELRGFDDAPSDHHNDVGNQRKSPLNTKKNSTPSIEWNNDDHQKPSSRRGSLSRRDKNESTERRSHSSTPSNSDTIGALGANHNFDVNDWFKLDGFPTLSNILPSDLVANGFARSSPDVESSNDVDNQIGLSGSRLSRWCSSYKQQPSRDNYRMSPTSFQNHRSKRGSMNDEYAIGGGEQKNILEILQNANINVEPQQLNNLSMNNEKLKQKAMAGKAKSVEELEAGLKQLVLGNSSNSNSNESETDIRSLTNKNNSNRRDGDTSAFNKLLNSMVENGQGLVNPSVTLQIDKERVMSESQLLQNMLNDGNVVQSKNDLPHVLRGAPTEQDILAGINRPSPHLGPQPLGSIDTFTRIVQQHEMMIRGGGGAASRTSPPPPPNVHPHLHPADMMLRHSLHVQPPHHPPPLSGVIGDVPPSGGIQQHPQTQAGIQQREMLMSLMKQQRPPAIHQQSASPVIGGHLGGSGNNSGSGGMVMLPQHVGHMSPRTGSPLLQDPNYQQRIPSPLIFSQQPPLLPHAPSPIHPTQGIPSPSLPNNTLQVQNGPAVIPRVPSPQELIARTQAIYHNALIQKKVEEQRGKFHKKQEQQRSFSPTSPAPLIFGGKVESPMVNTPSTPQTKVTMAAFTPTSVMRKMHSDSKSCGEGKMVIGSAANDNSMHPRPLHGQGVMNSGQLAMIQQLQGNISTPQQQPQAHLSPPRPIVKCTGGSSQQQQQSLAAFSNNGCQPDNVMSPHSQGGRTSTSTDHQQHQRIPIQTSSAPAFRPSGVQPPNLITAPPQIGVHPASFIGMPPSSLAANIPMQAQQQVAAANLLRSMLSQTKVPNIRGQSPMSPVLPHHQTNVGPRVGSGGPPGVTPAQFNPHKMPPPTPNTQQIQQLLQQAAAAAAAQQGQQPLVNGRLQNNMGQQNSHAYNSNVQQVGRSTLGGQANPATLTKWFGSDILKSNKLPTMPPVPTQKALSLEEVERQQVVQL